MKLLVKDPNFYKQVNKLAVPVVLQGLITTGVGMMDTFMVGRLGEVELSAVSLANQFIAVFMIMCFGLGYGAAVLTAQYHGSRNIEALKKIISIMLKMAFILSGAFFVATVIMPDRIMGMYSTDVRIISSGVDYFKIGVYIYIFMAISQTLTIILRSVGEVKLPLVVSILGFCTNVGFNYIFIFGKMGAPAMGVQGAALATLITRVLEALIIGGYVVTKEERIRYRFKDLFTSSKEYISIYIAICIPVLVSDTLLALGNNMVSVIIGHIGVSFVAANAVISQVSRFTMVFIQGISSASSVITGNTLGTGDRQRAYDEGVTFVTLSVIIGILAGIVVVITTPLILTLFEMSDETLGIAKQMTYALGVLMVFQAVQSTLTKGVLRGGGDTKFLMVADILFLWIISVPLGYLAGLIWHVSTFWILIALRSEWIIKSIWCMKRLFSGVWIKSVELTDNIKDEEMKGNKHTGKDFTDEKLTETKVLTDV